MKRLRSLLALGLCALVIGGCSFSIKEVSGGLMRGSRADPEPGKPAPIVLPQLPTIPDLSRVEPMPSAFVKAVICSGRLSDRDLLDLAAADPTAPGLIFAALRECSTEARPPLRNDRVLRVRGPVE